MVNLKTAKQISVTIPPKVLVLAALKQRGIKIAERTLKMRGTFCADVSDGTDPNNARLQGLQDLRAAALIAARSRVKQSSTDVINLLR